MQLYRLQTLVVWIEVVSADSIANREEEEVRREASGNGGHMEGMGMEGIKHGN